MLPATILTSIFIAAWAIASELNIIPKFMLPPPLAVFSALIKNFPDLVRHSFVTLFETFSGLAISIVLAFFVALLMDRYKPLKQAIHPFLITTQTVPTICVAPIIILFFGYGIFSKIVLVIICCFFPITIALFDGFSDINKDFLNLLKCMNATYTQTLIHLKIPFALPHFFSGLKIAVTYAFISAVVAEWLGGTSGLGVYMTRVKSAYSFDKLFASIIFISISSFLFIKITDSIQKKISNHFHL